MGAYSLQCSEYTYRRKEKNMEVEIFTLSDSAENYNGKLVIVGTFDFINAQSFPLTFRPFALSLRLRFARSEFGQHAMLIRLIDSKGKEIAKLDGQLQVNHNDPNIDYVTISEVMNFGPMKFETSDRYSFELYIDGEWKTGLPLNIVKVDQGGLRAA